MQGQRPRARTNGPVEETGTERKLMLSVSDAEKDEAADVAAAGRFFDQDYPWAVDKVSKEASDAHISVLHQLLGVGLPQRVAEKIRRMIACQIRRITCSAMFAILTQIAIIAFTLCFSSCQGDIGATYNFKVWLGILPALAAKATHEWCALRLIVLQFSLRCKFKVMTLQVGFLMWLCFYSIMSVLHFADSASDSMFAGTTVSALVCSDSRLMSLWEQQWAHSALGKRGFVTPYLPIVVFGYWFLSLLQMVLPLPRTMRRGTLEDKHSESYFSCCGDENGEIWQTEVLFSSADAAGMPTLCALSIKAHEEEMKDWVAKGMAHHAAEAAVNMQGELQGRVIYSYVLHNCLQLILQSSIYVLQVTAGRDKDDMSARDKAEGIPFNHTDFIDNSTVRSFYKDAPPDGMLLLQIQPLLSIGIGIVMSMLKLFEAKEVLDITRRIYTPELLEMVDQHDHTEDIYRRARRQWWGIIAGCLALIGTVIYAIVKIITVHTGSSVF